MKIYLDVCTICRPFDDQNDMRIRTETDAFYLIVRKIMQEEYTMVISPVHKREIEDINDPYEKSVLM